MNSLFESLFAPYGGYSLWDIAAEALAVITGLMSVWYARQENILVYPVGLISTGLYVYICLHFGLYGESGINAYYTAVSIYGWWNWARPSASAALPISRNTPKEQLLSIVLLVVFSLVLWGVLDRFTDSNVPLADGITTAIFCVAMWLMARKKLESWLYWIAGDLLAPPLYFYKGLTLTAFQYVIFLLLAVMGWMEWKKRLNENPTVSPE
ncbi:MAG: nicotinamide riboside transporter PnuC [Bacteroidetes bacterium]|nr:MAG: nicotinamide riboside transporter PnuC [Bacteroidota bacterium]